MGAKGSVEAAKLNADNWGHLEVCTVLYIQESKQTKYNKQKNLMQTLNFVCVCVFFLMFALAQLSIFLHCLNIHHLVSYTCLTCLPFMDLSY